MIQQILIIMARAIVDMVLKQLTQLFQKVMDEAMQPMKEMMGQVADGSVWIGHGANQFVEDVQSIMIPRTERVCQQINTHNTRIQTARSIIDRADAECNQLVRGQIFDAFKFY